MEYDLSSAELMTQQSNSVVIVDIRRTEEWKDTGIISGAKIITPFTKADLLQPDFQVKFAGLVPNPDTPFILYCMSGRSSGMLPDALEQKYGFHKGYAPFRRYCGMEERRKKSGNIHTVVLFKALKQ